MRVIVECLQVGARRDYGKSTVEVTGDSEMVGDHFTNIQCIKLKNKTV